jgi:metal transporter CNNM
LQLLKYDPHEALPVSSFPLSILPKAKPSINCFQALDYLCVILCCVWFCRLAHLLFTLVVYLLLLTYLSLIITHASQTGRAHLLLISQTPGKPGGAIGVITLEGASLLYPFPTCSSDRLIAFCADIIEEILSEEIIDETDQYSDNVSKQHAKRITTAAVMRGCVLHFVSCFRFTFTE